MRRAMVTARELAERLQSDPDYRARKAAYDANLKAGRDATDADAKRIVQRMNEAGWPFASLRDVQMSGKLPAGLPEFLANELPTAGLAKQAIVRAISYPGLPRPVLAALIAEFRREPKDGEHDVKWAIGNALEIAATTEFTSDLRELALDRTYGKAREMLVLALAKLPREEVSGAIVTLLEDPFVAAHAAQVAGKLQIAEAVPKLTALLGAESEFLRKSAADALTAIHS